MSEVQILSDGYRIARKNHQCFDCYRTIPKGQEHYFQTNKYETIYTSRQHTDCRSASSFYRKLVGYQYYDEGIPPLLDEIQNIGESASDFATLRGYFPHVVCRMEWHEQMRHQRLERTRK